MCNERHVAMFLGSSGLLDQLGSETLRLAFLAITGGATVASGVIGWFVRRDIHRSEAALAKIELEIVAARELEDAHYERRGNEIKDIQYRIGIMVAELRSKNPEVTIPEWPSR